MNTTVKTLLNSIFSILGLLVLSLLSIMFTRQVLVVLGSDYNGINATATQITSVLMLIEGGFSLASLVALFEPYGKRDLIKVNRLFNYSLHTFKKLSITMLIIGTGIAIGYSFLIKSNIGQGEILSVFILTVLLVSYRVAYTNTYRLIFQVSQTEYIMQATHLLTNLVTYLLMIYILRTEKNIVVVKAAHLIGTIVDGMILRLIVIKKHPYIKRLREPVVESISGTKDVFWAKTTSFIYSSSPVFFLSIFVGTTGTSVYAVYNSVVVLVANILNAFLNAPQGALGVIISEKSQSRIIQVFREYEKIAVLLVCIILATVFPLFLPFVSLFTKGIHDTEYIHKSYAILLTLISLTQFIHIPSGHFINLAGHFKAAKVIQFTTCVLLIVLLLLGAIMHGTIGIFIALLVSNIVLALMEMTYVRRRILNLPILSSFSWIFFVIIIAGFISISGYFAIESFIFTSWVQFFGVGIVLLVINTLLIVAICALWDKSLFNIIKTRLRVMISH